MVTTSKAASITVDKSLALSIGGTRARSRRNARRFLSSSEPHLSELIADPMLGSLMASDGIAMDQLMTMIADARLKLAGR